MCVEEGVGERPTILQLINVLYFVIYFCNRLLVLHCNSGKQ